MIELKVGGVLVLEPWNSLTLSLLLSLLFALYYGIETSPFKTHTHTCQSCQVSSLDVFILFFSSLKKIKGCQYEPAIPMSFGFGNLICAFI